MSPPPKGPTTYQYHHAEDQTPNIWFPSCQSSLAAGHETSLRFKRDFADLVSTLHGEMHGIPVPGKVCSLGESHLTVSVGTS